jgi:hypothetical protein
VIRREITPREGFEGYSLAVGAASGQGLRRAGESRVGRPVRAAGLLRRGGR